MPYIPREAEGNWKRRVRRPFYIFNSIGMIPVVGIPIVFGLSYLNVDGDLLLGLSILLIPLIPIALLSIAVNLVVAIAARQRDQFLSRLALGLFLLVVGLLLGINAKGLFGPIITALS